jgi:DNA-3-methyladenine glycosylase I
MDPHVVVGDDGLARCWWGGSTPDYAVYHDTEWGFPVDDDHLLFEKLSLEGFQSGLSWLTILRKRDSFRRAFHAFDYRRVAEMGEPDVQRLLEDASIVRHRRKIESTISNARKAIQLEAEYGSLGAFFWSYEPPDTPAPLMVSESPESWAMAKDLKRRGFTWVGPTTAYAFMQAMGIVNDHLADCHAAGVVAQARLAFVRPLPR